MKFDRFCDNPACESLDVLLDARQVLKKGDQDVCPKCLEPLIVRPARPRPRLSPTRPRSPHLQETVE